LTGDASWRPENMRRYFESLERCSYRPDQWLLHLTGYNPSRHGFGGWLTVELPKLSATSFFEVIEPIWPELARAFDTGGDTIRKLRWLSEAGLDPNDWALVQQNFVGLCAPPLTTTNHRRTGTRERLLDVRRRHGDRLTIELNALATKVLLDDANRAVGVEYLQGEDLYRAGRSGGGNGVVKNVRARLEVILAGGAFNTPQLLMLSGIGPAQHLHDRGLAVRVPLPGVGSNLQDRYEIGVVNRMREPWAFYKDATFSPGDPQFRQWDTSSPTGAYTSNGVALAFALKSSVAQGAPDLFCMSLLGEFKGYYPDFSIDVTKRLDYLTWVVLKGHTRNRTGTVRLRSGDPRDAVAIDFNYFQEGGDEDLQAMIEGVRYVRSLGEPLIRQGTMVEELPGSDIETDEQLGQFIRANAWGHHASSTCPIGDQDAGGVLSSDFRVHGVGGLRVVDASVFPRIPGFFIASATYMIAEKAAEMIAAAKGA
jgi:choline dehydrogenase